MKSFTAVLAVVLAVCIASSEAVPSRNVNSNTNTNTNTNSDFLSSYIFNSLFSQLISGKTLEKSGKSGLLGLLTNLPVVSNVTSVLPPIGAAAAAGPTQRSADPTSDVAADAEVEPSVVQDPSQETPVADTPMNSAVPVKLLKSLIAAKAREMTKSKQ